MDAELIKYLAGLGNLGFTDEECANAAADMTDIIAVMDIVKETEISYAPRKDDRSVCMDELRKDEAASPLPPEKVLMNAFHISDSFAVPRVVE